MDSNLLSTTGRTSFKLSNSSNEIIALEWISHDGNFVQREILNPNESLIKSTFSTHAWAVEYMKSKELNFQFYSSHIASIEATAKGPMMHRTENIGWSSFKGYGPINVARSMNVPDDGVQISKHYAGNFEALNLIRASAAWTAGYTGQGMTIAILDAGLANHIDYQSRVVAEYDAILNRETMGINNYYVDHALGVASVLIGPHKEKNKTAIGVVPEAKLLNVRVTGPEVNSSEMQCAAMVRGIKWAVKTGANVIFIPVQGDSGHATANFEQALEDAKAAGVVTVVIGGNFSRWGGSACSTAAQHGLCVAVGNLDMATGMPFPDSNVPGESPHAWVMASSGGIYPTADGGGKYYLNGGTSFAGPYVAGLAALLRQKYPRSSVDDIIKLITSGAQLAY